MLNKIPTNSLRPAAARFGSGETELSLYPSLASP